MNCGKRDAVVFPQQLANERIMHEPLRRRRPGDVGTKKMHANFFDAAVPEKLGERLATFSHTIFFFAESGLGAPHGGVELRP